jgi:hypothetical protein
MRQGRSAAIALVVVVALAAGLATLAVAGWVGTIGPTEPKGQGQTSANQTSNSGALSVTTAMSSSAATSTIPVQSTNSSDTTSNDTSISGCSVPVGTNSTDGLTIQTFFPARINLGDSVCIKATLTNRNPATIGSLSGNVTVAGPDGNVVFENALVPFEAGSTRLATGGQMSFQFMWNTSAVPGGAQVGLYSVSVIVQFKGLEATGSVESRSCLTLGGSTATTGNGTLSCSTPIDTNSTDGLTLDTYLPPTFPIGGSMNITAVLLNHNETTISSLSGNVSITDAQGRILFRTALVPFQAGSVKLASGDHITFQFLWNTTMPYLGVTPAPGVYTAKIVVQFRGMQPMTFMESSVNFTVSG